MALSQLALLQAFNGGAWALLGFLNVLALILVGGEPLFGWWQASGLAIVVALALGVVGVLAIHGALKRAEPAVGVLVAAPSQTVGRCLGPAGIAIVLLLVLALVPGGEPYRGLAALMFLAIGASYLPIAVWVRRFEEMNGVIVGQPVNQYGMRTGPIRVLRLPR